LDVPCWCCRCCCRGCCSLSWTSKDMKRYEQFWSTTDNSRFSEHALASVNRTSLIFWFKWRGFWIAVIANYIHLNCCVHALHVVMRSAFTVTKSTDYVNAANSIPPYDNSSLHRVYYYHSD
jgi:hypothetical protein